MTQPVLVEVCVASLQSALEAENAGADRIELNCALELDGLTPGPGLFGLVSKRIRIPIIAMARPRGGNFHYSDLEWETLIHDASWLLNHGASGVAFGCLGASGEIDLARCEQMRSLAGSRELVFHKAFDEVADWESGLETLVQAGVNRVMTSGQASSANEGIRTISRMVDRSAGRIEVLPAGRIHSQNVVELVDRTGVGQIHGSFTTGPAGDISGEIGLTMGALGLRPN